jgi:hypothetical protein
MSGSIHPMTPIPPSHKQRSKVEVSPRVVIPKGRKPNQIQHEIERTVRFLKFRELQQDDYADDVSIGEPLRELFG